MKKKGLFITFEGTEGVGKSTLIREVARQLRKRRIPFLLTREPGGTPLSEKIRDLLLNCPMHPWTELFLYEASRCEHVQKKILPALKAGKWVLCDRFTDSSLAYQGWARGIPLKTIVRLNLLATSSLQPDLTIWLDADPAVGLKRARVLTRFEREGLKFQIKVRQGFSRAMRLRPDHWLRLKVREHTPEELGELVLKRLGHPRGFWK